MVCLTAELAVLMDDHEISTDSKPPGIEIFSALLNQCALLKSQL